MAGENSIPFRGREFGFTLVNLERVLATRTLQALFTGFDLQEKQPDVDLDQILGVPGLALSEMLLWSPVAAPDRTVVVTNLARFGLAIESVNTRNLARASGAEWISLQFHPDPAEHCAMYYAAGDIRRSIGVFHAERGWEFIEYGTVQSFEDPSVYTARRIRGRLPIETLIGYVRGLGYPVDSPEFWRSNEPATRLSN